MFLREGKRIGKSEWKRKRKVVGKRMEEGYFDFCSLFILYFIFTLIVWLFYDRLREGVEFVL